MFERLIVVMIAAAVAGQRRDPATEQIEEFRRKTSGPVGILRTSSGAPVDCTDTKNSLNKKILNNEYLIDSLTHVVRERIPPRAVHAKGAGAFGYFETTHDISHICKATLFSRVGKRTPVAVRFSHALQENGGADTARDAFGFGVKFYTEDGNFDIPGLNTPMFVIKDPILFRTFAHSFKKNPATNLYDNNIRWDFLTLNPESLHIFLLIFSDRGLPKGYRHMPGFGIHTYQVANGRGESYFVRFHFYPDAGIKNLSAEEAIKIAGVDPDYATRDLYNAIGNGDYPSWQVGVQILTTHDVETAGFDVFDATKVIPIKSFPVHPIGRLVLNKNPLNYFAEVEQLAFCPGNLVPGIMGSPDKLFESRRFSYTDAQRYRLGVNFNNIPVNRPIGVRDHHPAYSTSTVPVQCPFEKSIWTYNRDGVAPVGQNGRDSPNYYPNSFHGAEPVCLERTPSLIDICEDAPNNFEQAGDLYANGLTEDERRNLIVSMVGTLCETERFIKTRAIQVLSKVHPDLARRVAKGLSSNTTNCM